MGDYFPEGVDRPRDGYGCGTRLWGQCSSPGGVLFCSWPTASVIRRQTAAPL